jgi:hypothetical protein
MQGPLLAESSYQPQRVFDQSLDKHGREQRSMAERLAPGIWV